jgi:hypothetical protein
LSTSGKCSNPPPTTEGSTPITALTGKDNPAAVVPVRFGERVIVGLLSKLPKMLPGCPGNVGLGHIVISAFCDLGK